MKKKQSPIYCERSPHVEGLGIQGLMKSFAGKKTFSGFWEEDLDSIVSVFDTMGSMCEVGDKDKLKTILLILSAHALMHYTTNKQGCFTYDEAVSALRLWYNNSNKRAKILIKSPSLRQTEELMRNRESSEVEVFRKRFAELIPLQKRLHSDYHKDKYLKDKPMPAVDIPSIHVALRDRIPRTAQQLAKRIANSLSEKARTAGSSAAHYIRSSEVEDLNHAMYTIRQRYCGAARGSVKRLGNKGPRESYKNARDRSRNFKIEDSVRHGCAGLKAVFYAVKITSFSTTPRKRKNQRPLNG